MTQARPRKVILGLLPWPERQAVAEALRTETVGGLVLLAAAVVALVWANSPWSEAYERIRDFHFGVPALGLDLSVGHWTADGLLALFFLVAGIELKREFVVGELRTPATAALPVIAAVCGMAVPAALYALTATIGGGSLEGWAVPMATDIAFALAVLAVISTHLPAALRAFLLTLAVVDDLGAILIIAVFFTSDLDFWALGGAFAGLVAFYALQRFRVRGWWWYAPLAITTWALMYNSGVHATVAGVAMGLILRTTRDKERTPRLPPASRTCCTLSPPVSRSRCSRSSPMRRRRLHAALSRTCSPTPNRWGSSSVSSSARSSASSSARTSPHASPAPGSTPTSPGPTSSGSPPWPGSVSPSPSSSVNSPSLLAPRPNTSRPLSSWAPSSPRRWPPFCCDAATSSTGACAKRKTATPTSTALPTSTSPVRGLAARGEPAGCGHGVARRGRRARPPGHPHRRAGDEEPGSARHEWTFLRERRGLVTFLATASVLSAVGWTISGPAYLSWVGLAALLVARVSSKER